ncbi:MAG: CHAT domain-containing protein [Gemmatimonadetes bacterium]|nr:CHAT domain-containing protein [Gemmatimonadota bacterium]
MMLSALGLVAVLAGAAFTDSTHAVVRAAVRAVEGDSAASVSARWEARLRRSPGDREAALGLGHIAQLQYRYETAAQRARAVIGGARDALAVRGHLLSAAALTTRARFREADTTLVTAMRLAEALGDSSLLAESMIASATTRMRTTGLAAADSLLSRAARLLRDDDLRVQASLRCARALVLATRGRPEARQEALAAADLALRAGERRLRASCLMVVAQDWSRIGRADSAGAVYDQVVALQRAVHDRAGAAVALQWRGYFATTVGEYRTALRDLREAVREGTAVRNPTPVAWASLSLAGIALDFGDAEEAAAHAARARASFQQSGDQLGASNALGVMGDMARAAGDIDTARARYSEALATALVERRAASAFALLRGMADLSMMEARWERAAQELDSARVIGRSAGMRGAEEGMLSQELLLALRRGRLDDAEQLLRRSARTEAQRGRAYIARVLGAEYHGRRGRVDSAQAYLTLALDEMDRWRADLDERQLRQAVFEPKTFWADPDLGFATVLAQLVRAGRAGAALELAERRRARELLDRLIRDEALGDRTTGGVERISAREGIRNRSRFYYERSISSEALQAALPDERTALLEFVTGRGGEPTTLFVLTRTDLRAHQLAPIDSLAPAIARFVRYAESGVEAPALASTLGEALLGAALRALPPAITQLVIVPDDVLHRVPFDALSLAGVTAVVDRFGISTVPSAAVARTLWQRGQRSAAGEVLALGDPIIARRGGLPAEAGAPVGRDGTLPSLPYTRIEVRRVARLAAPAHVRLAGDASEAWLRRTPLERYGIVHLATHAWVDHRSLRRTAVALSAGDGEDGFMRPADFAALALDADVVVLSACGTAGGVVVRGEGVLGLTAPVLVSGARAVVATGWRVGDRAAARLVGDFYESLVTGASVGEALRAAKVAARRRGAPVSEWAAFGVVGNATVRPRPVARR